MTEAFVRWLAQHGEAHVNADPKREAIVAEARTVVQSGHPALLVAFLRRLEIRYECHLREVDMLYAAWLREGRTDV